jgi:trimeric autotransporter adhesin
MQLMELNCVTVKVAIYWGSGDGAAADETDCNLGTRKGRNCLRKDCLVYLVHLTVLGLFVALAPMPTMAGEDERREHKEIEALEAKIASLQAAVSALQDQVTRLQTQLAVVQSNHALALGPFVSVDPNPEIGVRGPNIIFSGANIHIVSGSGKSDDNGNPRGLGNLIIGYDEDPIEYDFGGQLSPGDRGGSHNLVIGAANRFTKAAFAGLVVGQLNTISGSGASVSGGVQNTASGYFDSVSGGVLNTANGLEANVSGGYNNTANGNWASVSGGLQNTASGFNASVSGGWSNTASGTWSSVSGGYANTASGPRSSVSGGYANTASGGYGDDIDPAAATVIGGYGNAALGPFSIAPQPPFP